MKVDISRIPSLPRAYPAKALVLVIALAALGVAANSDMLGWQRALFIYLSRNAAGATDYFHIPAGRVVEIGAQVNI